MFIFGFAVIFFLSSFLLYFYFSSSTQKNNSKSDIGVQTELDCESTSKAAQRGVRSWSEKKINPATGLGFFIRVSPSMFTLMLGRESLGRPVVEIKKKKKKKQKNKLSHPFEGGRFKKISLLLWCPLGMNYTSTHSDEYMRSITPHLAQPFTFSINLNIRREFFLVFLIFTHHLSTAHPLARLCTFGGILFPHFAVCIHTARERVKKMPYIVIMLISNW